jgi:hypothetical protein
MDVQADGEQNKGNRGKTNHEEAPTRNATHPRGFRGIHYPMACLFGSEETKPKKCLPGCPDIIENAVACPKLLSRPGETKDVARWPS